MERKRVRGLPETTQAFQLGEKTRLRTQLCLCKKHSSDKTGKQWEQLWRGSIKFSHGTTSSKGVPIAFSKSLEFNIMKEFADQKKSLHCPSSRHSGEPLRVDKLLCA